MQELALEYAVKLQPFRGKDSFQQIADALNGRPEASCRNLTVPSAGLSEHFKPEFEPDAAGSTYFVSVNGSDTNPGTIDKPFASVQAAVVASRSATAPATIVLRQGSYFQEEPLKLGALDSGLTVQSYNGEEAWLTGAKPLKPRWQAYGSNSSEPLFVADLSSQTGKVYGLRVNGKRGVRARYPNNDPERGGFGPGLIATGYLPVTPDPPLTNILPPTPYKNTTIYGYHQFVLGIGGPCKDFSPPAGYWCGNKTQGGGGKQYRGSPGGITFDAQVLPHSPYKNATGAVVQMWRPSHWSSWMFEVGAGSNATAFNFSRGGFQGARGPGAMGAGFYVEVGPSHD